MRLPEDPTQWQVEILQELYKQVPYVSDFSPRIILDRVDAQRMVGFGNIEVSSKTQIQVSDPKTLEAAGINEIRIPIVIRGGRLCPLDLLVTGDSRIMPLTERRMRQELFRPELFDTTSRSPGDMSMISQLYPPYRQNYGIGGGGMSMGTGMGKEGSASRSLLADLLPRASHLELSKVASHFFADAALGQTLLANRATEPAVRAIHHCMQEGGCETKTASSHLDLHPTVVQIVRDGSHYVVKTANHRAWAPEVSRVDWHQLHEVFGEKVAAAVDRDGPTTLVQGVAPAGEAAAPMQLISEPGIYRCVDSVGNDVLGQVFPTLRDLPSGARMPIALFTNGQATAVQPEIVGTLVSAEMPSTSPRRPHGVGYFVRDGREPAATIPLTVRGEIGKDNQFVMVAETYDGRTFHLMVDPTIREISDAGDGLVLIPEAYRWVSTEAAQAIALEGPGEQPLDGRSTKTAHLRLGVTIRADHSGTVDLQWDDASLQGKVASRQISADDAVFTLAGCGIDPTSVYRKIAHSMARSEPVWVEAPRALVPAVDFAKEAEALRETVDQYLEPLRVTDLVKVAAFVEDPLSVDTLLSIGFINPE
ncbi:MAG: hypothetical protein WCP53_11395, partial [Verrucomicrobiota bacterium]